MPTSLSRSRSSTAPSPPMPRCLKESTSTLGTFALAQESCSSGIPDYSFTVATPAGSASNLAGASPGDTVVASMFQSGTSTDADIRDLTSNTHWFESDPTNVGDTGIGIGAFLNGPVASFATTTMKNAQVNGQYLGFESPSQFKDVSTPHWSRAAP